MEAEGVRSERAWRGRWLRVLAVLVPLAAGLAVRMVGLRHGAPDLVYHPDVPKQTLVARGIYHGYADPRRPFRGDMHRAMYPYGTAVMLGAACRLYTAVTGSRAPERVHRWHWAYWMRWVSVACMLLAGAAALSLVASAYGPAAALAAGLALMLEPVNVQFSHYGMNDVPLAALLLLCWVCAGAMARGPRSGLVFAFAAGLCAGAAFGVKYQGVVALGFPGVAGLVLLRTRGWRWIAGAAAATAAGALLAALWTCPLLRLDPGYFLENFPAFMRWQAHILGRHMPPGSKLGRNLLAWAVWLPPAAWLLVPAALGAGVYALRRRAPPGAQTRILVLSGCAGCVVLSALVVGSREIVRANDLLPVTMFLVVTSAVGAASALRSGALPRRARTAAAAAAVVVATGFAAVAWPDALALARVDTRERARAWCRAHMAPGTVVWRERYTLAIGRPDIQAFGCRTVWEPKPRARIRKGRFDYLVVSSLAHDRYGLRASPYYSTAAQEFYRQLAASCEEAARFEDRQLLYAQPTVTVYRRREDT